LLTLLIALLSLVVLIYAIIVMDFLFTNRKLKIPRKFKFIRIEKYKQKWLLKKLNYAFVFFRNSLFLYFS